MGRLCTAHGSGVLCGTGLSSEPQAACSAPSLDMSKVGPQRQAEFPARWVGSQGPAFLGVLTQGQHRAAGNEAPSRSTGVVFRALLRSTFS